MKETYIHKFPGGITATVTLDTTRPQFDVNVVWSQFPPPRKVIPEYMRWRKSFLQDFAAKTGKKIMVMDFAGLNKK